MLDPIDPAVIHNKRLLLVEPNMQAASVLQQTLTNEGVMVTYRSTLPERVESFDYIIVCLPTNEEVPLAVIEEWIARCKQSTSNIIIGTASTQLALSDYLMQTHHVQCLTKPLSRKKLLQSLVDKQPAQLAPAVEVISTEKRSLNVMAVDDNPANLKLITALLSERVETVVSCTSGQAAVQKAQEQHFDMVFMDIQMPQMDGVTACKLIKETQQNAATPVVAVTAHAMSGERDRLLSEGMDDYLTKPIDETMLLQVLNKWVPVRPAEPEACLDFVAPTDASPATEAPPIVIEKPTSQVIDWNAALKQAANKEDLAIDMLQMLVDFIPEVAELATTYSTMALTMSSK